MPSVLKQTRHGLMCFDPADLWIGESLLHYGEYSPVETGRLVDLLPEGGVAVDVGANIGCLTLPLAKKATSVLAFEPQNRVFQKLCANLELNNVDNVIPYCMALGKERGMGFLASGGANCGSASLCGAQEKDEPINITALDNIDFSGYGCQLVKVDVEGFEAEVLEGARATLEKFKPVLYVEADRHDKCPALIALIKSLGYVPFWDITPLWVKDNFHGAAPHNGRIGHTVNINLLCLTQDHARFQEFAQQLPLARDGDTFHLLKLRRAA
jgi:FkbM family methyltransferase